MTFGPFRLSGPVLILASLVLLAALAFGLAAVSQPTSTTTQQPTAIRTPPSAQITADARTAVIAVEQTVIAQASRTETAVAIAQNVFPGLTVANGVQFLTAQSLTCSPNPNRMSDGRYNITCLRTEADRDLEVSIRFYDPAPQAVVFWSAGFVSRTRNNEAAAAFFGSLADMPVDGANPDQVREWVSANISAEQAETTFGPAKYRLMSRMMSGSFAYVLDVEPAR